jgi:hypothetical protein
MSDLDNYIKSCSESMKKFVVFYAVRGSRSEFYSLLLFFEFRFSLRSEQALFGSIFLLSGPFSP